MFALIRQLQQLTCPSTDGNWEGEIDIDVSRPAVQTSVLPRVRTPPSAPDVPYCQAASSLSAPRLFRVFRVFLSLAPLAAEQYNLESYFPAGKQGSTSFDPNELNYIDATAGNYPNHW